MIITTDQMHRAIMTYLDAEIAQKATGLTKFATYFLISSLQDHPEKTVGLVIDNPLIKMTDVVNADGTIRADELYRAARSAMERCHNVTIAGITFAVPDIDKIYSIMQGV